MNAKPTRNVSIGSLATACCLAVFGVSSIAFAQPAPTPPPEAPPTATAPLPAPPLPAPPVTTALPATPPSVGSPSNFWPSAPAGSPPAGAPPAGAAPGALPWSPPTAQPSWQTQPTPGAVPMPPNYLNEPGRYPRKLPYDPEGTPPLGYREAGQPIRGLWIAGLSIFAGGYGGPAIVGGAIYAGESDSSGWLLAPVIGPIALGVAEYNGNPDERSVIVLLSLLSLTQATGVALFVAGLAAEEKVYLRNDVAEMDLAPRVAIGPGSASVLFPF